MTIAQAAVLGAIQGLAEFLPISSSAHLALAPKLLGWQDQGLAYDVALHWGTLAALAACFGKDWWAFARDGLRRAGNDNARLFDSMVLATIPGALAGLLLADKAETVFRDPHRIALTVAAFGVLLGWADHVGRKERPAETATVREVVLIGLAQALALVPGVSRSGITMTAALLLGFDRVAAARLAFLLAVPITAGAGLHQLKEALPLMGDPAFWTGIAASALVGVAAVKGLLRLLGQRSLMGFAVYRVLLGGLLILFGKV